MLACINTAFAKKYPMYGPEILYMDGERMAINCGWSGAPTDSVIERLERDYYIHQIWDGTPYMAYLTINRDREITLDSLKLIADNNPVLRHDELIKYYGKYDDNGCIKATWLKDAKIIIGKGKCLESYIDSEVHYEQELECTVKDGVLVSIDSITNNKQLSKGIMPGYMPMEAYYEKFAEHFPCDKYAKNKKIRHVSAMFHNITYQDGHIAECDIKLTKDGKPYEDNELKRHITTALKQVPFATYLIDGEVRLRNRHSISGIHFYRFFDWYNKTESKKTK